MNLEGCIGFSAIKGSFISKIIRWFTKSQWSHTFVIYKWIEGDYLNSLVIEAGDFELTIVPFNKYIKEGVTVEIYKPKNLKNKKQALNNLLLKCGTVYGYLQLIGFAIVILLRKWFGIKRKSNIFGYGIICSESVSDYLIDLGYKDIIENKSLQLISPEDVYRFVLNKEFKKEIVFTDGNILQ